MPVPTARSGLVAPWKSEPPVGTSPNRRAVPDRIITYKGLTLFLELKATGKLPTGPQRRDHMARIEHGACVLWTDSLAGVDKLIEGLWDRTPIQYLPARDGGGAPFKIDDKARP